MEKSLPSIEQYLALQAYANEHGRTWKSRLINDWLSGRDERLPQGGLLRQVRNQLGPQWLTSWDGKGYTPPEYQPEFQLINPFTKQREDVRLAFERYRNDDSIALLLLSSDGMVYSKVTTNLAGVEPDSAEVMKSRNLVAIKDVDEGQGIPLALAIHGIIELEPVGAVAGLPVYELTDAAVAAAEKSLKKAPAPGH